MYGKDKYKKWRNENFRREKEIIKKKPNANPKTETVSEIKNVLKELKNRLKLQKTGSLNLKTVNKTHPNWKMEKKEKMNRISVTW